jgi:hypothetical protein
MAVTAEQVSEFLGNLLLTRQAELPVGCAVAIAITQALLDGCLCAECEQPIRMTAWQMWAHQSNGATQCIAAGEFTGAHARPLEVQL